MGLCGAVEALSEEALRGPAAGPQEGEELSRPGCVAMRAERTRLPGEQVLQAEACGEQPGQGCPRS